MAQIIDINEARKKFGRNNYVSVLQIKITLSNSKPPIWRRVQVPINYSFWDLHVAIQDAMGWSDSHLHEFYVKNEFDNYIMIGTPDDEIGKAAFPERDEKIADYLIKENDFCNYIYDFGDDWEHKVVLEKILARDDTVKYPSVLKGKRACPAEDCGGIFGYIELLEVLKDKGHDDYDELIQWLGDVFDPEYFDISDIKFRDPKKVTSFDVYYVLVFRFERKSYFLSLINNLQENYRGESECCSYWRIRSI
jgi:hypothetical protein